MSLLWQQCNFCRQSLSKEQDLIEMIWQTVCCEKKKVITKCDHSHHNYGGAHPNNVQGEVAKSVKDDHHYQHFNKLKMTMMIILMIILMIIFMIILMIVLMILMILMIPSVLPSTYASFSQQAALSEPAQFSFEP